MTVGFARIENVEDITAEDQDLLDAIDKGHEASKPANTIKAYKTAQEDWHRWCLARAIQKGEKALEDLSETERAFAQTKR